MAKYPTQNEIHELFGNLSGKGSPEVFFEAVSPDVDWTVMGTHPLAGRYTSRSEFRAATFGRLGKIMKPSGLGVRNIIGGGDQPWAVVELVLNGVCNNGRTVSNVALLAKADSARLRLRQLLCMVHSVQRRRQNRSSPSIPGQLDGPPSYC